MMTVWNGFYIDKGSAESTRRLIARHRVSLTNLLPGFYREKIRAVPGVVAVVPLTWFGGLYKDNKPENFFPQFAIDPDEFPKVYPEMQIAADQLAAWQRDRAGVIVNDELAKKYGWRVGDRIILLGTIYPVNPELTVRGIYHWPTTNKTVYFNAKYVEEAVSWFKGQAGTFSIMSGSSDDVAKIASAVDDMFRNSPQPTKTESEKAFGLSFVNMLGNVKAFILSICMAVVFTTLLVSANTMAMSIRERTREVAVLKTLGFERRTILGLFVGEAMSLSIAGGLFGCGFAWLLLAIIKQSPMGFFLARMQVTLGTLVVALVVAALVGFFSALVPSYHASRVEIVEGLRHIG
jgi:putative ABC transport system permease protein